MTTSTPSIRKLNPNPAWTRLSLFDRKGWKRVRFGDVVRQLKEETDPVADGVERYVAGEHMETENVHIRKWGNVGDGYLGPAFIRRFRKGQVLYGSRRTYLKKVALAEWDGVTANTTFVMESVEGKLLQELLPWLMLSERFTKHSVQESKGSTNPYINFPDIAKFEFDLPPLDQQRRIAEILWAADEVIEKGKQLADAAKTYLMRRGDELLWEQKSSPQARSNGETTYGGITNRITYGFTNPMPATDDGPWMLTAKDVLEGYIDYSTARHTSQKAYDELLTAKSRPKVGDVLLTKDGTIGRVAVVDKPNVCISQSVALIEPKLNVVTPEFLSWSLRSARMQKRLIDDAGGSTIKHIYITKVASTPVVVPSLPEQKRIVSELEQMNKAATEAEQHCESGRSLLQALVETITGELA